MTKIRSISATIVASMLAISTASAMQHNPQEANKVVISTLQQAADSFIEQANKITREAFWEKSNTHPMLRSLFWNFRTVDKDLDDFITQVNKQVQEAITNIQDLSDDAADLLATKTTADLDQLFRNFFNQKSTKESQGL